MDHPIDRLYMEIDHFLIALTEKRKVFSESMEQGDILDNTKPILKEIKELEAAISGLVAGYC